jgi:hypothetical protein
MATVKYETLFADILPMVQGCPDPLIINAIRAAVIEFCEKTGAYQVELEPITTISGTYEYDLEAPTGYNVHKIVWLTYEGNDLETSTPTLVEQNYSNWRASTGTPEVYVKASQNLFQLIPVPDSTRASSVRLRAQLKPNRASTSCDSAILDDYRDAIVNGALFRILRIPSRDWSDLQASILYSKLYQEGVLDAERRARGADSGVARKTNYGGLYTRRNTGKYANRRIFRSGSY